MSKRGPEFRTQIQREIAAEYEWSEGKSPLPHEEADAAAVSASLLLVSSKPESRAARKATLRDSNSEKGRVMPGLKPEVIKAMKPKERARFVGQVASKTRELRGTRLNNAPVVVVEGEEVDLNAIPLVKEVQPCLEPCEEAAAWIRFEGAVKQGDIVAEGIDLSMPPSELPLMSEETQGLIVNAGLLKK